MMILIRFDPLSCSFVPEISNFLSYAALSSDNVIYYILIKYDEKRYQKCLILGSKIILNVLHNMSLTLMLPWQHTRFHILNIESFSGHLKRSIFIFAIGAS